MRSWNVLIGLGHLLHHVRKRQICRECKRCAPNTRQHTSHTCTTICQNNARRHRCTHKRLAQTIHSWSIYLLQSLKLFWMLAIPILHTLCITHCAHFLTLEANACVAPASTCLACAAGKSSPTNAAQCSRCAAGWHNAVDAGECNKCISRVSPVGATGAVSLEPP